MRRIRPTGFEQPIADGAVLDHAYRIVSATGGRSAEIVDRIRRVRGSTLTMCMDVRSALDALLLAEERYLGADRIARAVRADALLTDAIDFAGRVETMRPVLRHLFQGRSEMLLYGLLETARLFRLMCTRPFFIVLPPGATDNRMARTGRLAVADTQFLWHVDDQQQREWNMLLMRCRADLDEALGAMPFAGGEAAPAA